MQIFSAMPLPSFMHESSKRAFYCETKNFTVQLKTNILKVLHELSTCMSDKPNFKRNAVLCAKMIEVSKLGLILIFFSTPPPPIILTCTVSVRKTLKSKDLNLYYLYIGIGYHLFLFSTELR